MGLVIQVKSKVYQISHKLVHQGLRYGVSDGTCEAKKEQPKLHIRTLVIAHLVCPRELKVQFMFFYPHS